METEKRWTKIASDMLLNRKIVAVRYLTAKAIEQHGWYSRGVVITLDNGLSIYPSKDDEGNDAGALFTTDKDNDVLPVL